jgi:C_GCAxxG_C_C family probable redox protein
MSDFDRREFFKRLGIGTAVLGIGLTAGTTWTQADDSMTGEEMDILQIPDQFIKTAGELAFAYAGKYHGCAQCTLAPFLELWGFPKESFLLASASLLSGGSTRCLTCGAITGGLIALGLKFGRRRLTDGFETMIKAEKYSQELIDRFKNKFGAVFCCDLTGYNIGDPVQREAFFKDENAHRQCPEQIKKAAEWTAEIICRTST